MRNLLLAFTAVTLCGCSQIEDQRAIEAVKGELLNHYLSDPKSAVFSDMRAVRFPDHEEIYVCGRVNAKNAFGGYIGKRRLVGSANPHTNLTTAVMNGRNTISREAVEEIYSSACKGADA